MSSLSRPPQLQSIRPEMTIRQIVSDFPTSRPVFLRHGEADSRRGKFGHLEPLSHFARRRNLPLPALLDELAVATAAPIELHAARADRVHRPFLLAALLITLTLGAGWGGWLLWKIGIAGDFRAVPGGAIVAHGEAQLWGFITLFILGISLRTALRPVARHKLGPVFCGVLLATGLSGVAGGFLWFLQPQTWPAIGPASAALLLLMALVFWTLQVATLRGKWPATWARAVIISGLWLSIWAGTSLAFRIAAGPAGPDAYHNGQRLLIIELAVFGFAMNSIYGYGQLFLPGLLRLGAPRDWALETTWWLHNLGTAGFAAATVWTGLGLLAAPASLLLAAAAVFYAVGQRAFFGKPRKSRRPEQGQPSLDRYPPLAFFWLLASLTILAAGYAFLALADQQLLPHALVGAARHALTVGFMTTLILGVGQRLLPVFEHRVLPLPGLVLPILLLVGAGNLLRVTSELAVLVTPIGFPIMPLSVVLEWSALLLFAVSVVATFWSRDPLLRHGRVTASSSVAVLLAEHPELEDWLIDEGYDYLARARSVPKELTIRTLAERKGDSPESLVQRINSRLGTPALPGRSAAVAN